MNSQEEVDLRVRSHVRDLEGVRAEGGSVDSSRDG